MRPAVMLVAAAIVLAGCGGTAPKEEANGSTVGAAPHTVLRTTKSFLNGQLTVALEDGWQITEDSPGHFGATEGPTPTTECCSP